MQKWSQYLKLIPFNRLKNNTLQFIQGIAFDFWINL